jgi:hypothetical protein
MMLIVKNKQYRGYVPLHEADMSIFKHCTGGFIGVDDINAFMPVFNAHGIQVIIQDETLSGSNVAFTK